MCKGVKDTIFCRKIMVAVPMKLQVSMGRFPYTAVSNVLLDPGETKVSKKEILVSITFSVRPDEAMLVCAR